MKQHTFRIAATFLLLGFISPGLAGAQEIQLERTDLPRHVADGIVAFFNDPGTMRFSGKSTIPANRSIVGNVGILGGAFVVAGEIDGSIMVMDGDLELRDGSRVTGNVTIVGGRLIGDQDRFSISGTLSIYEETLHYTRTDHTVHRPVGRTLATAFEERRYGRARFTARTGTNYNRVEGLPVMFGPVIESGGRNPLRLDAFGVWRSTSGLNLVGDELGYSVRVEQGLFGWKDAGVGLTLHSEVQPVERWGITDLEASLTTFLLHRDYRDYYDASGWSGFIRGGIPNSPLTLLLEYRDEEHRFAPVLSPWSLRGNQQPWRPQPLVGEGRTRSLAGKIRIDSRNEVRQPSSGWLIEARTRAGLSGDLSLPSHLPLRFNLDPAAIPAREIDSNFVTGFLDLRRYNRVSPTSRLSLRGVAGGSLTDRALPPQFQHALGGEGSIPGHKLFSGDCGARNNEVGVVTGDGSMPGGEVILPSFSAYGCDRIALFQMEFQGGFNLGERTAGSIGPDEWDWYPLIDLRPSWSVFFNAGRGWALPETGGSPMTGAAGRSDSETMMDIGAGIFLGALGLYWAIPLDGDRGVNFFVRLSHRF